MKMTLFTPKMQYEGFVDFSENKMLIQTSDNIRAKYGVIAPENGSPVIVTDIVQDSKIYTDYVRFSNFYWVDGNQVFTPSVKSDFHIDFGLVLDNIDNMSSYELWKFFIDHKAVSAKAVDRMLVCPECSGIPTVRPGCPECGHSFIKPDQLVHHYKCGNVDFLRNFEINREKGSLTCGKCHESELMINCDYDVSVGLHRCMSCGWTGDGPKMIGNCLSCHTVFRMTEAKEIIINEYTVL